MELDVLIAETLVSAVTGILLLIVLDGDSEDEAVRFFCWMAIFIYLALVGSIGWMWANWLIKVI